MDKLIIFGAKFLIYVLLVLAGFFFLRQDAKKRKEILVFAVMALPLIFVMARIGESFFLNPRPFVVGGFVPLVPHDPTNGFPSDHTLLSAAVAMIIFFFNRKIGTGLLALAFLVGFSRVSAGVHHWLDVFGSFGFAIVFAWLTHKFLLPIVERTKIYKKYFN